MALCRKTLTWLGLGLGLGLVRSLRQALALPGPQCPNPYLNPTLALVLTRNRTARQVLPVPVPQWLGLALALARGSPNLTLTRCCPYQYPSAKMDGARDSEAGAEASGPRAMV